MFIRAAKPTARMTPQRAMSTIGRVSSIVAVLVGWLVGWILFLKSGKSRDGLLVVLLYVTRELEEEEVRVGVQSRAGLGWIPIE